MIKIQVNNREIDANPGEMLLEALNRAGIKVPTLCYMKDLFPTGACRMCVVEVEGAPGLVPSCAFPVREGLKIQTHSERAVRARKTIVELLLSNHPDDCLYCSRNGECHLQNLSEELGIRQRRYTGLKSNHKPDTSSPSIVREPAKCILCGKCVRTCEEIQGVSAIDFVGRGSRTVVSPAFNRGLNVSSCVDCGQCILACPTGALTEKSKFKEIFAAINDPKKFVVVQHAPAVSVTLGELFGINPGVDVAGVMNAALRRLGFDRVFDTSFSADLTIMEEASELFHRIKTGGKLPMFTSCCPAWIDFMEQNYPDMLDNLSTCKSPQQMLGAVVKTFYAERQGLKPEDIYVVSVMPCTAKKYEAQLPTHSKDGYPDVDAVITTRELARIIKMRGLHLESMEPEGADTTFGERSSAGKLFGATGGVMEAAIRTAHYLGTGGELEDLKVKAVRGLDGVKEAKVKIGDLEVGVAVAHTLGNARKLVEEIRNGRSDLHFIEIMSCPGGCVGGGGQPIGTDIEAVKVRMKALYMIDKDDELRVSHKNQQVQRLYDEYLGQPLGEKSHHILHTEYSKREVDF
ncbi:MAG TPA: NADH-dependent [FeFe] hydrogenase, group A6 [Myxococcota bacterium]|nr:NADH-dependent [FeFe] hydrogenase, group A6 [Myxococcota bacterium]